MARGGQKATFEFEEKALEEFRGPVAGIDEAGRGPWAGPVVAAAVVLKPGHVPAGLADSKALSAASREELFEQIIRHADTGVGVADVVRIDRDNILQATMWAMQQAVHGLGTAPGVALVDGNKAPRLACACRTIVKGDALSLSIAAASIVAKVTRDRMMVALGRACPGYGFERHKGYGTVQHRTALERLGVTEHHRRSFRPIRTLLEAEQT